MPEHVKQHTMMMGRTGRLGALASWLRPSSYWTVMVYHFPLALISGIALLLPHVVALGNLPTIPCTFLHLTGYPCPLCGFTRSFWAIANGQWASAFANCPLAFAVFAAVILMFLWHAGAMVSGVVVTRGPGLRLNPKNRSRMIATTVVLLALNWAYRLSMGWT